MKIVTTILTLLIVTAAFTQRGFEGIWHKAFDFSIHEKYDSSLFYFQQVRKQFPQIKPLTVAFYIGDCFLKLGDTTKAEKHFLRCLSIDKRQDSFGMNQTRACNRLYDIYFNRKQFREALTYLESSKTKYKPLRRMCAGTHGGYEGRLTFAYKRYLCYYALNKKDSAISVLAPLIFRPVWDVYLDTLEFDKMSRHFAKTVFEIYGVTNSRKELQAALNHVTYQPSYDNSYNMVMFSVDCLITFANTQINLSSGGGYQVDKKGDIPEYFSKETLLKEFMESPAYRYIMIEPVDIS